MRSRRPTVCFSSTCWALACLLAACSTLAPSAGFAQQSTAPAAPSPAASSPPRGAAPVQTAAVQAPPSPRQIKKAEKFYAQGVRAMQKGDVDTAEKDFAQAAKADPSNPQYAQDQQIASQHRVTKLIQDADKARILGQSEAARADLAEALALDPKNPEVAQHIEDLANRSSPPPEDTPTATFAPAVELTPKPGKQSFHFKTTEQEALRRVLEAYGLKMTDDGSLGSQIVRFDVDDVDFYQAAHLVNLATHSFLVPLDPVRVLAAKESKENHEKYDRLSVETIYLPGLTPAEFADMGNLAKNVLGILQANVQANAGTLTVRAPAANLRALNQTLTDLLDGKSEVLLDVKVYEVENTRTRLYGIQLPQSVSVFNLTSELNGVIASNSSLVQQIIASGLANAGDLAAIAAILIASGEVTSSILTQPFATFGNGLTLTGLSSTGINGNLNLNSSDTRTLNQVQIRLDDNAEGTIRSGTRYPIITSSYSGIAATSVSIPGITSTGLSSVLSGLGVNASSLSSIAPIPQVQYEDLGLIFKVTPRIERGSDDVTLKLDLKIQALQGSMLNGLPVLTNRSYTADIHLVDGASALVVGDLSRTESNAISGTPGLSELPGFTALSSTTKEYDVGNIAILVTPHVLRRRHTELVGPVIPIPHHS
jgi:general secretion pathway protein D